MTIELTPAPALPSLNDPATFNPRTLALFSWLVNTFISELEGITPADLLTELTNGTAAAPSLAWLSDPDTGFFRPGENQIGIVTGGVRRMLLSASALTISVPLWSEASQVIAAKEAFDPSGAASGEALGTVKVNAFAGGTAFSGLPGGHIAFGRPDGSGRRKAAIGSVQHDNEPNRVGLLFYCYPGTTTSTDQVYPRMYLNPWGSLLVGSEIFTNSLPGDTENPGGHRVVHHGNLLGAVSWDGGAPTGAVIERGSNANGHYTKYADGTMECWHVIDAGDTRANGAGTYADPYRSGALNWTFPASFSAPPSVQGACQTDASGTLRGHAAVTRYVTANYSNDMQVFRLSSSNAPSSGYPTYLHLHAVGRWK
ncbi:hypothetical protein [Salipiger bermudensis]|uniref:hypothetical protein n=1 Tax=Salipiger bermudensis TaxID=344736 RepID=UPI001CD61DB0|nr:hypothetical protein [Salipiger bermudensis]MCA0963217.1 hypothetical protein [Salipiger bermudensis]